MTCWRRIKNDVVEVFADFRVTGQFGKFIEGSNFYCAGARKLFLQAGNGHIGKHATVGPYDFFAIFLGGFDRLYVKRP